MLNCKEFLKTIYFGDRFCTKVNIDCTNNKFELHLNRISRIRDNNGNWNYYDKEDIENGIIVINDIESVLFDDSGLIPNDQIYAIYANEINNDKYEIIIEASNVDDSYNSNDIVIKIIGKSIHLKNPVNGLIIKD